MPARRAKRPAVPFVEAKLERLVALEHEDGLRIEEERGHLPAAELETVLDDPLCLGWCKGDL